MPQAPLAPRRVRRSGDFRRVVTPAFWGWLPCPCFCRRFLFLGPGISFASTGGLICLDRAWLLHGAQFAFVGLDVGQWFRLRIPSARGLELFCPRLTILFSLPRVTRPLCVSRPAGPPTRRRGRTAGTAASKTPSRSKGRRRAKHPIRREKHGHSRDPPLCGRSLRKETAQPGATYTHGGGAASRPQGR